MLGRSTDEAYNTFSYANIMLHYYITLLIQLTELLLTLFPHSLHLHYLQVQDDTLPTNKAQY